MKNEDLHLDLILQVLRFSDSSCDTGILEKQEILLPISNSMNTLLFQILGLGCRQILEGSIIDTKEKVDVINLDKIQRYGIWTWRVDRYKFTHT